MVPLWRSLMENRIRIYSGMKFKKALSLSFLTSFSFDLPNSYQTGQYITLVEEDVNCRLFIGKRPLYIANSDPSTHFYSSLTPFLPSSFPLPSLFILSSSFFPLIHSSNVNFGVFRPHISFLLRSYLLFPSILFFIPPSIRLFLSSFSHTFLIPSISAFIPP